MTNLLNPIRLWPWLAALALALGGCGVATTQRVPAATPAPTLTPDQKLAAIGQSIDTAERAWEQQGIDDYRLTTAFVSLGADITMTVVVRDGQVVEHTCVPDSGDLIGCDWANQHPDQYTVRELFADLRKLHRWAQDPTTDPPSDKALEFVYDDQLGYPKRIVWHPVEYMEWTMTDFERLP
jgi:hypothetical protein